MAFDQIFDAQPVAGITQDHRPQPGAPDRGKQRILFDRFAPHRQTFDEVHRAEIGQPGLGLGGFEEDLGGEHELRLRGTGQCGFLRRRKHRGAHVGDVDDLAGPVVCAHDTLLAWHFLNREKFAPAPTARYAIARAGRPSSGAWERTCSI